MILGLVIISAIILMKYKPMYSIRIGNKSLGYLNKIEDLNIYLEEIKEDESIAFVDFKEEPELNIKLVNRNIENSESNIKEKIEENLSIEYTSYAVTYNNNNIAYLSNMKEAENVVNDIKKEKNSEESADLGILQVYSNNYEEIKAVSNDEATTQIAKAIEENTNSKEVKVASTTTNNKTSKKSTNKTTTKSTTKTVQQLGISLSKPLSGTITSRYGGRTSPGGIGSTNHKGIDIATKAGTAIQAAASGTVKFAGYKGSLGNLVIIDNGNNVETYYGHCSKLYVEKGQKVEAGETIAAVGSTGAATGPHLHFEIHVKGTTVNPQNYVY